jgi:WS/DGAT/MGAT family acyltransferase
MDQLSPLDSVFIAGELPGTPQHVGGLVLLDPSTAPDFGFEKLVRVVDERIRLAPRYTRRLREVAGGLDRPWLVDDPGFDVRRHVHRVAVPAPGTMRELAELVGLLFPQALDRGRPLWEMWLIEGAAEGRSALLMKSHHCLMDGAAASGLGSLLCDLEPEPKSPREAPPAEPAPEPGELRVALTTARHLAGRPVATLRLGGRLLRQGFELARAWRDPESPPLPFFTPKVSFNGNPGPRRAFACASVSLEAVKAIRKHFDVTVNDVVLALTGSAVRRYLAERGELPRQSLVVVIAVSLRAEGDISADNQVTTASIPWATDRSDPVARLLRIHRAAERAKSSARGGDSQILAQLGEAFAPGLVNLFFRIGGERGASLFMPGNAVVSNVRGTPVPLYIGGARIESMFPLSILAPTQGLNITAVSYCGRIDVGFTVDPDLVPDPWQLAEGVPLALAELTEAMRAARGRKRGAAA